MKKIIIFSLLIFFKSYGQNIDKIMQSDTAYFYFKKNEFNQVKNSGHRDVANYMNYYFYLYKTENSHKRVEFSHHKINSPEIIKVCKSFIKKNKDLIISLEFLEKKDNINIISNLRLKKKIYIIDKDNVKLFSIKLVEVKLVEYNFLGIE